MVCVFQKFIPPSMPSGEGKIFIFNRAYSVECEIPQRARTWAVLNRPGPLISITGERGKTWDECLAGLVVETKGVARTRRIRLLEDIAITPYESNNFALYGIADINLPEMDKICAL
jgi:hypothetical protein